MDETFNDKVRQIWNKLNAENKNRIRLFVFCIGLVLVIYIVKFSQLSGIKEHVFFLGHLIFELCFFTSVLNIICIIWSLIKKEREKITSFSIKILVVTSIFGAFHLPQLLDIGSTQIGSFYEKSEYTELYYVRFSKEPATSVGRKEYMLPAKISKQQDYDTNKGFDITYYRIDELYFSNGQTATFYNTLYYELILYKEVNVRTDKGEDYYITLTDIKK